MLGRTSFALLTALAGWSIAGTVTAASQCKLEKLAELPVTMASNGPQVQAKINGTDTRFLADSGAFYSIISPATARQLQLSQHPPPFNLILKGVGGSQTAAVTTVNQFTLAGIPLRHIDFIVGGSEPGAGASGIIGQNVLRIADVEYDLANGVIRLIRPKDCKSADLAYWAPDGQPYSVMEINYATPQEPNITGAGFLNGARIQVVFDTGAQNSMLTLRAAERAGIKPDSPGVVPAGPTHGIGRDYIKTWIAPFASFKVGDEEIRNTRLRFGDIHLDGTDMLLGDDFFLSHRVYVASGQRKVYFTYSGGPVFNLKTTSNVEQPAAAADGAASLDAEGFARRGAAFAARQEYDAAIADFTHACEMAPREPQYFFERARAYLQNKQPQQARADLEQALKLKADHVPALMLRSQILMLTHDEAGAVTDLDAADHASAPQADIRLALGELYAKGNRMPQAISQYDQWIEAHPDDVRLANALNARCYARASAGFELDRALSDCNKANRLRSGDPGFLQVRGLLRLRMGDYANASADFQASLQANPRNPWSLYGRGEAELHQQKGGAAETDFAAATALQPHIAQEFKRRGFTQ